ncbi:hypothetical protein [Streptomyces pseudovenezuelae]|uniref:hypothetical protein n=1 Tax=Streptomyces pseudovenezuelae TaxID=67350 RepID=UPI0036E892B8
MGLEDALREERRLQDDKDAAERQVLKQRVQMYARLTPLLEEALECLRPFQREILCQMEETTDGPVKGPPVFEHVEKRGGNSFREMFRTPCWVIKKTNNSAEYPDVVMLLDAVGGVFVARVCLYCPGGEYEQVYRAFFPGRTAGPFDFDDDLTSDERAANDLIEWWGDDERWIDCLERDLAETIVRYERGRGGLKLAPYGFFPRGHPDRYKPLPDPSLKSRT